MKQASKRKLGILRALAACALLTTFALPLAACSGKPVSQVGNSDTETVIYDKAANLASDATGQDASDGDYWDDILAKYRGDVSVQQILLVKYTGGWNAVSQFYIKSAASSTGWNLVFEDDTFVGRDGAGTASSYQATTPMGDFTALEAFGIADNPGTALPYVQVTNTVYGSCDCTEDCPYFNTIHDVAENGHWQCTGEHMIDYPLEYNYGLNFDYNMEKNFYAGSAFFVHCKGNDPYTYGCIALDQDHMVTVLQMATPGMRIVIAEA